jgi:outer membrane biosynthesis protein TonB
VPDPLSLLRLVALIVFIALVAVGLWLLDVAWWVVPPVMAVALLIAWTIEWLAWRGSVTSSVALEADVPAAIQPPTPEEEPAPAPPLPPLAAPEPVAETPPVPGPRPPEPQPQPVPEPDPQPIPEPQPEPTPEPEPEPAPPEPVAHEETVVTQPVPEAIAPARRPRRFRLRSVPSERPQSKPEPVAAAAPQPAEAPSVVEFRPRTTVPREWNLWDLERIARQEAGDHPERRDEWSYLFLHLRQFAHADGSLPAEFDPLVRESFGGLLERAPGV